MPEAPEIQKRCLQLRELLVGRSLLSVETSSHLFHLEQDEHIQWPLLITSIDRRGKWMVVQCQSNSTVWLLIHHGMNGQWSIGRPCASATVTVALKSVGEPLYFSDFGAKPLHRWILTNQVNKWRDVIGVLAPNLENISWEAFCQRWRLLPSRKSLVTVLMDQRLLVSGIGNYLLSEILHRAGDLPPQCKVADVNVKRLYQAMQQIYHDSLQLGGAIGHRDVLGNEGQYRPSVYGRKQTQDGKYTIHSQKGAHGRDVYFIQKTEAKSDLLASLARIPAARQSDSIASKAATESEIQSS